MIEAAILHDVMEDCGLTKLDILANFNGVVCNYVCELTNPTIVGNRAARKQAQREKISSISKEAKLIKLLDRIDNISELDLSDPFAKIYARETIELLEVLKDTHLELEENLRQRVDKILKG
jgi:(p)ppGpp synthase/HD superfamily hydrolase